MGLALVAALGSGCSLVGHTGTPGSANTLTVRAQLVAFDSCTQMLDQVRAEALSELGPYGLPAVGSAGGPVFHGPMMRDALPSLAQGTAAGAGSDAPSASAASPAPSPSAPGFSTTNVQEAGVDEPDLAKTDGALLVTLVRDRAGLQVADVGATARLRGFLPLGDFMSPTGILLVGGDVVVLGAAASGRAPEPVPQAGAGDGGTVPIQATTPATEVAVVSVSDPDNPVVVRSFLLQGSEVDARLVGGHVEVVVTSGPTLPFVAPADGSSGASRSLALAANTAVVEGSRPADWLPSVTSEPSGVTRTAACTTAMHPDVASGLGTVSVVPIDPASSQPGPEVTVLGDATSVYASTAALYVATTSWPQLEAEGAVAVDGGSGVASAPASPPAQLAATTDIHGFDLSDPATPRYIGSAEVPGSLIGQYAMSEYEGYLRVATTVGSATPPPMEGAAPSTPSDSRVTILQPSAGALVPVATLSGLGAGEKIYAVRFLGPLGYVVTFRQTDPLYVLDLSDPHDPQQRGQLALTGYSSFLEPLSNGMLLGIGQSVDANLRTNGLQLSLFDVSDPAHPALRSRAVLAGASSSAQDDPHALLYWAPAGLAVLPVTQMGSVTPEGPVVTPFDGAVAFRVTGGQIAEAGRVQHPAPAEPSGVGGGATPIPVDGPVPLAVPGPMGVPSGASYPAMFPGSAIERALVVGSMLYTVSESGILVSDLRSFDQVAWLGYP